MYFVYHELVKLHMAKVTLFFSLGEESKNLYLRYMINYLKLRAEEKEQSDDIVNLDVIKNIQREIVQSSNGVLTERRFHKILESMREV